MNRGQLLVFIVMEIFIAAYSRNTYAEQPTPNCLEKKTTIRALESIAKNSKNQQEFLDKIPKGSLQTFTFVTRTQSLHKGQGEGAVSDLWPRVLRFSNDGKIVISYVCNEKNETYGTVETLFFNDDKQKFETVSFDFRDKSKEEGSKIKFNQQSCTSCHSYQNKINNEISIKPIFHEYNNWFDCDDNSGISFYGGQDDFVFNTGVQRGNLLSKLLGDNNSKINGCDKENLKTMFNGRNNRFQQFKELQKNNPCFSSLPWKKDPKIDKEKLEKKRKEYLEQNIFEKVFSSIEYTDSEKEYLKYRDYPYRGRNLDRDGQRNLNQRVNLKLTKTLSSLNARRLFKLISDSDSFSRIKYLLAMEASGCNMELNTGLRNQVSFPIIKNEKSKELSESLERFDGTKGRLKELYPILYSLGKDIGLEDGDWSLRYNDKNNLRFNSVIDLNGGERDIADVVAGMIYHEVVMKEGISKKPIFGSGYGKYWGENFKCLDNIIPENNYPEAFSNGHEIRNESLCRQLWEKHNLVHTRFNDDQIGCEQLDKSKKEKLSLEKELKELVKLDKWESIKRGKSLVNNMKKGKCIFCHSPNFSDAAMNLPGNLLFIPSESATKDNQKIAISLLKARADEGGFVSHIKDKLDTKQMPLGTAYDLNDQDRVDILNYLGSLISK